MSSCTSPPACGSPPAWRAWSPITSPDEGLHRAAAARAPALVRVGGGCGGAGGEAHVRPRAGVRDGVLRPPPGESAGECVSALARRRGAAAGVVPEGARGGAARAGGGARARGAGEPLEDAEAGGAVWGAAVCALQGLHGVVRGAVHGVPARREGGGIPLGARGDAAGAARV